MASVASIDIDLSFIKNGLKLVIDERRENSLFDSDDAYDYGEAQYQLVEGCFYDYELTDVENSKEFKLQKSDYIQPNTRKPYLGVISPNIYVGTLAIEVFHSVSEKSVGKINLEVRSIKSDYRTDYRNMLENITEKCTDLIMQIDSPISQHFETNFDVDNQTLYQRFSFVKSLIDSKEFEEAVQKIISNPTTKWLSHNEDKDIRGIRRFNQKTIKQLISKNNRTKISETHFLNEKYGLSSVPTQIESERKIESIDTSENRFIKHVLEEFLFFCENCEAKFEKYTRAKIEANILSIKISNLLNQNFFKEISRPVSLKLNSPVLQRKSGYREVLSAWLKFDLAAKLIWHGGDNVYDAGKKNIATLYEYWLFFVLLDLLKEVFKIEPKSIHDLIQFEKGKLSLNLKQGTAIALKGVFEAPSRKLNIQFSYNRSFGGGKVYPNAGSYTTTLRPDYTLSIWPADIVSANDAEKREIITHIHFDAKYKVNNFYELVSTSKEEELNDEEQNKLIAEEEEETKKGTFKNQDLLKMHAYKDAIRRTGGAYILYPGEGKNEPFRGFHELIPGLGAFVIKPNKEEKGKEELKKFILKVVSNFIDRTSQREYLSSKIYDIHKDPKSDENVLKEPMPEYFDSSKVEKIIPDETFVLLGYYKSPEQLDWVIKNGLYNFRAGTNKGSLPLGPKEVGAKYIVLHGPGEKETNRIYKLKEVGPKIFSKQDLIDYKYPTPPTSELYLMFAIEKEVSEEFNNIKFDLSKLSNYSEFYKSKKPVTITLSELMAVR